MKPRTKNEEQIVKLSSQLGSICSRDEQKLIKHTYGTCDYKDMCDREYAVINQAYRGYQVMRYFRITRHRNRKREVSYSIWEVQQVWNKKGSRQTTLSRRRAMSWCLDAFTYSSELTIRPQRIDIPYDYCYNKSLIDTYRYCEPYMEAAQQEMYRAEIYKILSKNDTFEETLFKASPALFAHAHRYVRDTEPYMAAYKVAIRHGYAISDVSMYVDYISALIYLGKDTHNPFYVCPDNLLQAHDKYVSKMETEKNRAREEERRKKALKDNDRYIKEKQKFFGIFLSDGNLTGEVLKSVDEFIKEGDAMHNCVFACGYYNRKNSLIFSVRDKEGKRVETVEFDLISGKVIQAYGCCNKISNQHKEVLRLVNSSAALIESYNNNNNTTKIKTA